MLKRHFFFIGACWVALFWAVTAGLAADPDGQAGTANGQGPHAALKSLDESGRMQISAQDRCPLCGMFPAKRPKSAAAMVLKDGRTFYFCANGCLLRAWRQSDRRLKVPVEDIQRMVVQDYFSGATLDAHEAWWVAGSNVVGPMGPALVALESEQEVAAFKKRHGGRRVFRLRDVDDELWSDLFPPKPQN